MTVFFTRYKNGRGYPVYDHASEYRRHWTDEEIAVLARGFIDHDLEGRDLHNWCLDRGVDRTPGSIDYKLADLKFFDKPSYHAAERDTQRQRQHQLALARCNLANQIKLAKLEAAAGVPPFRPTWETC